MLFRLGLFCVLYRLFVWYSGPQVGVRRLILIKKKLSRCPFTNGQALYTMREQLEIPFDIQHDVCLHDVYLGEGSMAPTEKAKVFMTGGAKLSEYLLSTPSPRMRSTSAATLKVET
jgi:hypothetical protein